MISKRLFEFALALSCMAAVTVSVGEPKNDGGPDYLSMTPEEMAEQMIFSAGTFDVDQPVQEGGTAGKRLE